MQSTLKNFTSLSLACHCLSLAIYVTSTMCWHCLDMYNYWICYQFSVATFLSWLFFVLLIESEIIIQILCSYNLQIDRK